MATAIATGSGSEIEKSLPPLPKPSPQRRTDALALVTGAAIAVVYAPFKLLVTGVVQIYPHGLLPDVPVPFFTAYTYRFDFYEPLLVWYPSRHLVIAISWWQMTTTALLATLVGYGVFLFVRLLRMQPACRACSGAVGLGLAGAIPSLLSGLVCCGAGWLGVVFGGAVALLPPYDLPLTFTSFTLMGASIWFLRRELRRARRTVKTGMGDRFSARWYRLQERRPGANANDGTRVGGHCHGGGVFPGGTGRERRVWRRR